MHDFFKIFRSQCPSFSPRCRKGLSRAVSPLFSVAAFLAFSACITMSFPASAAWGDNRYDHTVRSMPAEYGEVIYRINEDSPRQVYIIGISHRDPESGRNTSNTVQTQAEIYRIGEWLNSNRELQLVLPEGYFGGHDDEYRPAVSQPAGLTGNFSAPRMNTLHLVESLADESRFINAEILLMEHYNMQMSQIEDKRIYNAVLSSLGNLNSGTPDRSAEKIAELRYLQEIRTAMLLQNIPDVIEYEHLNGTIRNRSALFTIGLNHIQDIMRYLEKNSIRIDAVADQPDQYSPELNLLKHGYGITVIIPRTLADNRELLRMTNLDRMLVAEAGRQVNR